VSTNCLRMAADSELTTCLSHNSVDDVDDEVLASATDDDAAF